MASSFAGVIDFGVSWNPVAPIGKQLLQFPLTRIGTDVLDTLDEGFSVLCVALLRGD